LLGKTRAMRAIRGVLFDMGDTLLGRGNGPAILREEARKLGSDVDDATARRIWREIQDKARTADEIAKGRDLSARAHRECWTALYSEADVVADGLGAVLYEREISAEAWQPFPDTLPVVEALGAAGVPMVVVSDTGWDIRPVLDRHGLLPFFAGLVLSYEHGAAKPAPQLFSAACALLGVEPDEALMVGDNALTDGGAIESGLRVYLLPPVQNTGPRGLDAVLRIVGLRSP
jgi:HAD superfamily hydrolase (TIGR01493 family)